MATEIISAESRTATLVDSLVEKFRAKLERLVEDDKVRDNAVLTHFNVRVEYGSGQLAEWVTSDGNKFRTHSTSGEDAVGDAVTIPTPVKKLLVDQSPKSVEAARKAANDMMLNIFATLESGVCMAKPPMELRGLPGFKYSEDKFVRECQKFAHAKEKLKLRK